LSVQAVEQQILSAQKPVPHCSFMSHLAPWSRLTRQVPPSQKNPVWQSAWTAQAAPHESPMHTAVPQLLLAPGLQTPLPSQLLAAFSVAPVQPPFPQTVPAG
jgi:hypothetical protein